MAVDYFLQIEGIEGESQDKQYPKTIQLQSWSWGETQTGSFASGGGGGGGKVNMQDFHFVMKMNKASTLLFQYCANGGHIPSATLYCRKAAGSTEPLTYFTVKFADLLISSYQTGGSGGSDDIPIEQISFNFAKIFCSYQPQGKDGKKDGAAIEAGWDLKQETAWAG